MCVSGTAAGAEVWAQPAGKEPSQPAQNLLLWPGSPGPLRAAGLRALHAQHLV